MSYGTANFQMWRRGSGASKEDRKEMTDEMGRRLGKCGITEAK